MRKKTYLRGFTLVELLIVVAIIALLAAALFVAVDPARRIGTARDSTRWSDVTGILNAILTYTVDTTTLPTAVSDLTAATNYAIMTKAEDPGSTCRCTALTSDIADMNLKTSLVSTYLATIPVDPSLTKTTATCTGYYINKAATGRIKIGACYESAYATASIEVQR